MIERAMPNFHTSSTSNFRRWIRLPRIQFSVTGLLIIIVMVFVLMTLASSFRDFLGSLFFVTVCCILPTPFVVVSIFGRGDIQSFAIGALVPWLALLPWMRSMFLWLLVLPLVCGTLAVVTRRWLRLFGGV